MSWITIQNRLRKAYKKLNALDVRYAELEAQAEKNYAMGYNDGEASAGGDWYHALTEFTDVPDSIEYPKQAADEINKLIAEARLEGAKSMRERIVKLITDGDYPALVYEETTSDHEKNMLAAICALRLESDDAVR